MWPVLYLPQGETKTIALDSRTADMKALLLKLQEQRFNGYVKILAFHEHGLLLFHQGRICNCFYEGTIELELSREQIIRHFLPATTKAGNTVIKIAELDPQRLEALSALETKSPVQQELETVFLDMNKLFDTLCRKNFTGTLRFYQIRNNPRLGNILLKMKKITADQLREAIQLQLSGAGALRLGDALVKIKALTTGGLKEALARQLYTRKSSDNELALALFFEGAFLGGYTSADKILTVSRQEVLAWISEEGVLLDIIEGVLPGKVLLPRELESELESVNPETSREEARPLSRKTGIKTPDRRKEGGPKKMAEAPDQELQLLIEETLNLKGDDLILDIGLPSDTDPFEPKPDGQDQEISDSRRDIPDEKSRSEETLPEAETAPSRSHRRPKEIDTTVAIDQEKDIIFAAPVSHSGISEPGAMKKAVNLFSEEDKDKWSDTKPLSDDLQGIDYMRAVMEKYMGFLGPVLLEREQEELGIPVRTQSKYQLRIINKHLFSSASLIVGPSMARRIVDENQARIGGGTRNGNHTNA
ncbi:hypothetical protein KAR10_03005 [bacterium]|nr:hypothetical protein [bacterium]